MFGWFRKSAAVPKGPDFSGIDSKPKAEARLRSGELEKLMLLPAEFGGTNDPRNIVFVPRGFAAIKANIDMEIIKPLVAEGKITQYQAIPEYQGNSFIPIAIKIVAAKPGSFTTDINIWGQALARTS